MSCWTVWGSAGHSLLQVLNSAAVVKSVAVVNKTVTKPTADRMPPMSCSFSGNPSAGLASVKAPAVGGQATWSLWMIQLCCRGPKAATDSRQMSWVTACQWNYLQTLKFKFHSVILEIFFSFLTTWKFLNFEIMGHKKVSGTLTTSYSLLTLL